MFGEIAEIIVFDISELDQGGSSEAVEELEPLARVPTAAAGSGGVIHHAGALYAFGRGGIEVFDLSEERLPVSVGMASTRETSYLARDGSRIAASGAFQPVEIFDINPDGSLSPLAATTEPGFRATIAGDRLVAQTASLDRGPFGFPIGAGELSDGSGNVQAEGFFSLTDGLLDAQRGDIFGLFFGPFQGESFDYLGGNIAPALRQDPAALPFVRLDDLRKADVIVPAAAELVQGSETFPVTNLINGSGLNAEQFGRHRGFENDNWVTDAAFPDYFSGGLPAPVLQFDLGRDVEIDGMLLWQYSFGTGGSERQANSARDLRLQFATESEGPGGIDPDLALAEYVVAGPPQAGEAPRNFRERHAFSRPVVARYVQMTVLSNYAGEEGFSGGDRVGLGELAFLSRDLIYASSFEAGERR